MATDVLALMDALDLDHVHLAGHDWGGDVAFRTSKEEMAVSTEQFDEDDRAEAASRVYRSFLTTEARERPSDARLTVPTKLLYGSGDPVIKEKLMTGYAGHADAMAVEKIDGGHWLPEEHPQIVADRIITP